MARRGAKRKSGERFPSGRLRRSAKAPAYTPERERHDPIERCKQQVVDAAGDIGNPMLVVDLLMRLERDGAISPEGHAAARDFRQVLRAAVGTGIIKAADPSRSPFVSGKRPSEISDAGIGARRVLERQLSRLGGRTDARASAAWHVIGLDMSLRDWVTVRRWSGHRTTVAEAREILIAAVEALIARRDHAIASE